MQEGTIGTAKAESFRAKREESWLGCIVSLFSCPSMLIPESVPLCGGVVDSLMLI